MTHDEIVREVLKGFDCEKVHRAMVAVDWHWNGVGVPSADEIRSEAERLIRRLLASPDNTVEAATGGLYVRRRCDGDYQVKAITLHFSVERSEALLWDEPLDAACRP